MILAVDDLEAAEEEVIKRVAFAARYSSTTLTEALNTDSQFLDRFNQALATFIREENTPRKG
jgi:hypothetical protein